MNFSDFNESFSADSLTTDCMTINAICDLLKAEVLCCKERLTNPVINICGCDLLNDVLAFTKPGSLLLTGLTNSQVIRTAEILDLKDVVFVRNKKPDVETIKMVTASGIPLLSSPYPMYESCGRLYARGLKGCADVE